jgi:hypothetical protein
MPRTQEQQPTEKRDPGYLKLRRGLLPHLYSMSSNAAKLYVCLLLRAHWQPGPKRGWVAVRYEDLAHDLGWSYSMVRRTILKLIRKNYIEVRRAANQYELTQIKILKYDLEECNPAPFTGEPTKTAESFGSPSAALSAVSIAERSTEHSNPATFQNQQDLQTPKKLEEVKKARSAEKNEKYDAVRRLFDVQLPVPISHFKGASRLKRKQNLTAHLAAKIRDEGSFLDYIEDCKKRGCEHPFDLEKREAFAATGYVPDLKSPLLGFDFVMNVQEVYDDNRGKGVSSGNLCSKIIDYCERERKRCGGGNYYPPDFVEHRDRLRAKERTSERRNPLHNPTPVKQPTNRDINQLGAWRAKGSTPAEIADLLERRGETVADYLADCARARFHRTAEYEKYLDERNVDRLGEMGEISYYKNIESIRKYSAKELQLFTAAFAEIGYGFAWDNPLLGSEFCENVRYVVEDSQSESTRPKTWELCERVLDRCEKSWSELGEYSDVGLPYCPPDFNDHIHRLFKQEEG